MARRNQRSRSRSRTTRTLHNRDPLATILESLRDGLEEHPSTLANRGRDYYSAVSKFIWREPREELVCSVKGSLALPYVVSLFFDQQLGRFDEAICTCPYSEEASLCKHTYAAIHVLHQRLSDKLNPLAQELFQLGDNKLSWKVVLNELDGLLETWQREDQFKETEKQSQAQHRLSWRIGTQTGYRGLQLEICPYEQKPRKNGGWTAGRRLSWDGLCMEPNLAESNADRHLLNLAIKAQASLYSYYESSLPQTLEVLETLINHPLVSWEDSAQDLLTIQKATFGLGVDSTKEGLMLSPQLDGKPIGKQEQLVYIDEADEGLAVLDRTANAVTFARLTPGTLKFLQALDQNNTAIPNNKQEELLTRLGLIESRVPISLPSKLLGGSRTSDERMFLRLTPCEPSGVKAELRVQPAPEGSFFEPGSGPVTLTTVEDDKRIAIERNLPDEIARANALLEDLQLAEVPTERTWSWRIEKDDDALDLVSLAQDRANQDNSDLVVLWPEGLKLSITREATTQSLKVEIEDRKDWFGLKGMIEIDGEKVQLADLLAAVRNGSRYVAIGKHKWLRIAQAFRERLANLADVVQPTRSGLEIDVTAAFVAGDLLGDEGVIKACKRWKDVLRRLDESVDLSPDPPITLTADLRDYQLDGYRWLRRLATWGVGGCLADDMGLGKTIQTLSVLIDRMEEGPTLVVAPTSVAFNWVREAERFAPTLRTTLYRETDRGEFLSQLGEGDLLIASYGLMQRDAEKLATVKWGTLVLDEAQKVKNSQTKTAHAVRDLDAKWRLALTGTPVENHLGELWSMFRAISPGLLGSWDRFRERFAEPIERRKDAGRRHALARTVRPFILRRTKSEVLSELPQRTETQLTAELSPKERKLYDDARLSAIAKLVGGTAKTGKNQTDPRFEVLAALTRLRQLACHPGLVDAAWNQSSAKLDLFLEVVEELREGKHRALVFSQFTQHLALLRKALDEREITYRYLDGSTPARQREVEVDAFQRGEGELFLISLKAGGTGLNLTAADYVIHMDPWWNPAVEDQATDRAHRIGQTRPVTVYRLVAKDTIEEQILALHADKRNLVAGVLEGADQAGKLSTEELIALIRDQAGPTSHESRHEQISTADPSDEPLVIDVTPVGRALRKDGPSTVRLKGKTRAPAKRTATSKTTAALKANAKTAGKRGVRKTK